MDSLKRWIHTYFFFFFFSSSSSLASSYINRIELEMLNGTVQWTEILAISSFKGSPFTLFAPCDGIFMIRKQIISQVYQWFGRLWSNVVLYYAKKIHVLFF